MVGTGSATVGAALLVLTTAGTQGALAQSELGQSHERQRVVSLRALPRVPVEITKAAEISPAECSGRNWVFVSFKADVPNRQFRAVIRSKIGRSWIFSFETERENKVLPLFIKGKCSTIYRMLEDGVSRARVTVVVSAPGYRDTKVTVEFPVRY